MDLFIFDKSEYNNGTWTDLNLEKGNSYSYGDFKPFQGEVTEALYKSLFIMPPQLSGSDYSGGITERSNHRAFLKQFKDVDGVYDLYGGYGTYGIAIQLYAYNTNEEIKEVIEGFENYALVSDEEYSELESEYDRECVLEATKDLIQVIDLDIPDMISENAEHIENLIWEAIHNLNLYFEHETNSSYIKDDGKIKQYVEDRLLIDHYKKLPLLINREWVCPYTEQLFKSKLMGETK